MHFRRQRDILLTLQDSRLTLVRRLLSKDADLTAKAIAAELGGLPARARRTITHDNGGEFARHEVVTAAIGLGAYFCDPTAPGSAARSRTRMACSAATFRARPPSPTTPTPTSTTSLGT
jgi:IS30 family transposase